MRQSAIRALPIGMMSSSANGREVRSRYFFLKGKDEFVEAIQNPTRHFAKITILGERRPYVIEILVLVEQRQATTNSKGEKYKVVGQDVRLANLIKQRMEAELAKRREDLNIIDDFRVF